MSDYQSNINILTFINVSWASELVHNLFSTIAFAKKDIKIFLQKAGQSSKIVVDKEIYCLVNIIEN